MRTFVMSAILASALVGCGNHKCDELKTKLCEGLDEGTCKMIKDLFDKSLEKGPTGEKMSDGEKDLGCKVILDDEKTLELYRKTMKERAKK